MRPALQAYASRLEMQLRTKTLPWWSQTLDIRHGVFTVDQVPDKLGIDGSRRRVTGHGGGDSSGYSEVGQGPAWHDSCPNQPAHGYW